MIRSAVFLLLLAGMVFLQPGPAWSVHHLRGLGFVPVLLACLLVGFFLVRRIPVRLSEFLERPFIGRFFWVSFFLLLAASAGLLIFFRFRLFLPPPQGSGDSLLLLEHVPAYSRVFGFLDSFDEVLDLYLHSRMYLAARAYGFFVEDVYAWTSFAAGVVFTGGLLFFLRGRPLRHVILGIGVLYFTPALQLYAGYVENYSLASVSVSIVLFASVRLLEKAGGAKTDARRVDGSSRALFQSLLPILCVAAIAAGGALFHLLGSPVLFALVYLVWVLSGRDFRRFILWGASAAGVALFVLIPAWSFFLAVVENPVSFGTSFTASPAILRPGRFFSLAHVLDMLNLLCFASPAGILFLVSMSRKNFPAAKDARGGKKGIGANVASFLHGPPGIFLGIASLTYWVHASIWNSHIGFPADWDLFTFFQGPLNLLVFHLLIKRENEPADQVARLIVVLCLGIFFSVPWLSRNASDSETSRRNKEKARANVDELVRQIESDPIFPVLKRLGERRNYVKVKLFRIRCLSALADDARPASIRAELRTDLEKAVREYELLMVEPDAASGVKRRAVWDELTRLNLEINGAGD